MTHFLDPRMTAFQAEVELGSLWKVDPERAGPMISHLNARSQELTSNSQERPLMT